MSSITIEEQLRQEGYVLTLSVGVSMRPMLTQRTEQLLIEVIKEPLNVNDVVLYKRANGQYVLHRIVRDCKAYYLIRGDNCYGNEKVFPQQIIGILKGFYKGDKFTDCKASKTYRCYVAFWRISYPVRFVFYKCWNLFLAVITKIRR